MKHLYAVTISLLLLCGEAAAGSRETFYGALMGAAVGSMVGHHSSGISTEVAIPAFAALGALAGYGYDRGWYDDDVYRVYDPWDYDYRHGDRYRPRWHYRPRRYRARPLRPSRIVVAPRSNRSGRPAVPAPNLHPGVKIHIVPVALGNGVSVDLRVLEVNGRFIGPQGEEYDSRPTAEVLAQKYRP